MFRLCAAVLLATLAGAQTPAQEAPPDVDHALRARIEEFYHYFISQEYRKAEKLIAEDSQDFFYNHAKPHYLSTEIQSVTWSANFTRARAVTLCEQFVMVPGFADRPLKVPTASTWKIVDGQWFWYVDPEEMRRSPFGMIPEKSGAAPAQGGLPASIPTTADFTMNLVKADTQSLKLKEGDSARVTIANTARGPMHISVEQRPRGVEAVLDHADLDAGAKAVLTVRATAGAKAGTIELRVLQTRELIPIAVAIE